MFMTTMYRCRIKKYKTMEVQVFNSIAEAMKQTVEPGTLCFIKDESMDLTELTKHWDESEASSIDKKVRGNPPLSRRHSRKSHKRVGALDTERFFPS